MEKLRATQLAQLSKNELIVLLLNVQTQLDEVNEVVKAYIEIQEEENFREWQQSR